VRFKGYLRGVDGIVSGYEVVQKGNGQANVILGGKSRLRKQGVLDSVS
jgi:hypothetical protein